MLTIPIGESFPLATTSHFFEFIDGAGEVRLAHELERGREYEVVLTNGAGLWRYRIGDAVECTGHVAATPSLRFLGRVASLSDLRGEKLSEPFVARVIRDQGLATAAVDARLCAWEEGGHAGYAVSYTHLTLPTIYSV